MFQHSSTSWQSAARFKRPKGHKRTKNVIIIKKKIIALHIHSHRTVPSFASGHVQVQVHVHVQVLIISLVLLVVLVSCTGGIKDRVMKMQRALRKSRRRSRPLVISGNRAGQMGQKMERRAVEWQMANGAARSN